MFAQNTLISYHTEAFVKAEVGCTVLAHSHSLSKKKSELIIMLMQVALILVGRYSLQLYRSVVDKIFFYDKLGNWFFR